MQGKIFQQLVEWLQDDNGDKVQFFYANNGECNPVENLALANSLVTTKVDGRQVTVTIYSPTDDIDSNARFTGDPVYIKAMKLICGIPVTEEENHHSKEDPDASAPGPL